MELLARVEALARRSDTVIKETVLRVGDLELDLVSQPPAGGAGTSTCFPENSSYLSIWFAMKVELFSRTMLLQHVWDLHFDPTD